MKRPLVALMVLAVAQAGSGQSCFRVVESGSRTGLPDCRVRCTDGQGAWLTDASGSVCVPVRCDSVGIEKAGFTTVWASLAVAEKNGTVEMTTLVGTLLKEVVIEHWPRRRDRQALAATGTVDSALAAGFERSSLRSAAQWMPGVQWDERGHGGSARLSIRGSLLRSPYGVRGVKVYWGPFPLTLADGSTPLELLDPLLVGSLDITRSVGSPMHGSAPSGLLHASGPFRGASGTDATVEAIGGSFDYSRVGTLARTNQNGRVFSYGVVHQRHGGYRQQESSARDQAFIASSFVYKKSTSHLFLTWQKASWDLPGSLDEATAENDPTAARAYSVLLDAHVDKQQLMGGLANELRLGEDLMVRIGVHGQLIDKTNPYGTSAVNCGYKEETVRAAGTRVALGGDRLFKLPIAWDLGMEALAERDRLEEYGYVDRTMGDLKVNGDTRVTNLNAFATTLTRLTRTLTLHAGVGMERTHYDHADRITGSRNKRTTTPLALPYAGAEQVLGGGYKLHLRYAQSVSRATVWELLGSSGLFNRGLRGEQVREWEVGVSNELTGAMVRADLTVFHRAVKDLIVQEQLDDGSVLYTNRDQAVVAGCEVLVRGPVHQSGEERVALLASVALTATDLRHTDPAAGGERLEDIPGIPTVTAALLVRTRGIGTERLGLEAGARLLGSTPTGGPATTAKHVEHARLSYAIADQLAGIALFIHCENLFNARYSSWIQVNDPGGRYYNPAPARCFFIGAKLTFGSLKGRQAD